MSRSVKLVLLAVLVVLLFGCSLMAGKVWVPLGAWFSDDPLWWIIIGLRLPRAVLGLAIGGVLGLSGAVLQGYLRNPLADPAVVGVSSAAALGAVAAIVLGLSGFAPFACSMAGAAGAVALLAALTWRSDSSVTFILAGTVLASLAGAITAFLISIAPDPYATAEVIDWLMGALTDRGWADAAPALPPIAGRRGGIIPHRSPHSTRSPWANLPHGRWGSGSDVFRHWSCSAPDLRWARASR